MNLQELRKGLTELREGLKRIRDELTEHFSDLNSDEKYAKKMVNFVKTANVQIEDLTDDVNNADTTFTEVVGYYGEEERLTSAEFYGIFKTFVTSYRVSSLSLRLQQS